jgi:hypothetical protein
MGIYSDGKTYGINFLIEGESVYKKLYEEPMGKDQIQHAKVFFDTITDKNTVTIRFYINACSTYEYSTFTFHINGCSTFGAGSFMTWFPADLESLQKLFMNSS